MNNLLVSAFIFLSLTISAQSFAQYVDEVEYLSASITTEYCVSLDSSSPVGEYYEMDISHLHLSTEKDANDRFGFISNNLLTYVVDFEENKVYLQVHLNRTPEPKDIVWWNSYIDSLCGL